MNTAGDAAESTFRIVIEETEFILRISGSLLKETIAMLYAISKDNKQNSIGKTNLSNMLKNCKDIRIFTIQKKDLDKFVEEAKNYGIYYCTLIDKDNKSEDAIVDIMVRGDDAPRVNRIVERFDLSITDTASLRTESIKENGKEVVNEENTKEETVEKINDDILDDIMGKVQVNEQELEDGVSQDFLLKEEVQSELSFEKKDVEMVKKESKPSVKAQLAEFKKDIEKEDKTNIKDNVKSKKQKKKDKKFKLRNGGKKDERTR